MKTAALLVALLALPAAAQDRAAEIDFENYVAEQAQIAAKRGVLERTIVAMNDGPEAGGAIVAYMREKGIEVGLASQSEASKTVVLIGGGKKVLLSDQLPAYPRVYAPLIAKEIAALIYGDMPACAERAYMRRATAGRVWTELGGQPKDLPIVEPTTAELVSAVSAEISDWAKNGQEMALYKIGLAEKLPSLYELEQGADKATMEKLEAANKRFVAFIIDEKPARAAAGIQ